MALALKTITDSIAALTVPGLTILDIDQIPSTAANVPVLYPEPVEFITNFSAEMAAFGTGTDSRWNVEYDLNYTLLYKPVGSARGMELFAPTIELAFQVVDAILAIATLAGAVTLRFQDMSTPGPIADPAGNSYFGVQMRFHALEFVN